MIFVFFVVVVAVVVVFFYVSYLTIDFEFLDRVVQSWVKITEG